jgi:hypothetical protein
MGSHTFTRQELYDLVWSEPMIKLAERYGISGNGLAKACLKADIPVPERGYWNKLQAGHKVAKTPLPTAKRGTPLAVTIRPPSPRPEPAPPPPIPASVQEKMEAERHEGKGVNVPATLSSPHRIIAAWLEEDRKQRSAHRFDPHFGSYHKPVDKTDLDKRRLRILSALFKAVEARGYELRVDASSYARQVKIGLGKEEISIVLEERIRHVRRQLSGEEKIKRGHLSSGPKWTQERLPSGELVLRLSHVSRHRLTTEWNDAEGAPLEAKLDEVMPQIAGAFEELRLRRQEEAEEAKRRWLREEEARRAEMERKRETIRLRRLMDYCEDWRAAANIRTLVAAVAAAPLSAAHHERFAEWKDWALRHADRLDPLDDEQLFDRQVSDYEVYSMKD